MKNLGLFILMLMFTGFGFSQSEEVKINTSAQCDMCKKRIEDKLNYTSGVKYAELDVDSKVLTVKYSTKKLSKKKVQTIVSDLGYNADDVKRNETAHSKLPGCCQSSTTAVKACCSSGSKSCSKDAKKTTTAKACCSKDGGKSCSKKK
jgi:copper chaperone CopZ